ncbi:MAG: alpha/beta hydrolase [Paucimonas sp.]|jgi:pimeloyl-ACP methyl ester carboxylesterase|nr:alpha/beta hydrolase [Paucimonas sp.]
MNEARRKKVQCLSPTGLHHMAYKEWGDPDNAKVLVCVHGVTRISDDFDNLARAMSGEYRVVCPDVVGRGQSGRLRDPRHYQVPQYVSDMVTLLARLEADTVHWVGTSMGGLIGIGLTSLPENPVSRLVLNDIGPTLNAEALKRIGDYIGQSVRFPTLDEAVKYIRDISDSFGPHTDEEWRKIATDVLRQDQDGQWIRHYDLGLAVPFKGVDEALASHTEKLLWAAYDAITCPTLLMRGTESDLLSRDTAMQMTQRGPKAKLIELPGVGHAPTFVHDDQIAIAREFLLG